MRTTLLAVPALVVAAALMPAPTAAAILDPLQVSVQQVHVGESVTVTGNFCPNTGPEPTITYTTQTAYPKAPIMTLPLSLASVGFSQNALGFTFTYTTPTAKTWVWFTVTCGGSEYSTSATPVTVYPLIGEHWFLSPYGALSGAPGTTVPFTVRTMDCDDASTANLSLVANGGAGATIASATGTVSAGVIEFSVDLPADTVPGSAYAAIVDCASSGHGTLRGGDPFTVLGEVPVEPTIPETGPTRATGTIALLAGAFVLTGLLLSCLASRSSAPASPRA